MTDQSCFNNDILLITMWSSGSKMWQWKYLWNNNMHLQPCSSMASLREINIRDSWQLASVVNQSIHNFYNGSISCCHCKDH